MSRRSARNWLVIPLAIVVAATAIAGSASGADPVPGGAGTDTSLPLTDSAITVSGRGKFTGLEITVNQTKNLANQAVSLSWEGGAPTIQGPGRFGSNYLQIFQCWGDDDGSVPANPGPPPEQCVQGATAGAPGVSTAGLPNGFTPTRLISRDGWENFDESQGFLDPVTSNLFLPFRAVDGIEIPMQTNPLYSEVAQNGTFWINPYYGIATTNEVVAATTQEDGTGAELMQLLTGVQSSGLGCGQRVEPFANGDTKIPQCWIVVVPRGTPTDENVGTPFAVNADQAGVSTSPLAPEPWKNRIAIPIEFNPVDAACSFADEERRLSGNELVIGAVSSWQPLLCGQEQLPPFSYGVVGDGLARQQLAAASTGAADMVVVSRPLSATQVSAVSPVVYAPLTLSGLTVGFNIERIPRVSAPPEAQRLGGVRIQNLNLTPRLIAKLLTQSYATSVTIYETPDYEWLASNSSHLAVDPDFLRFNPEFELLEVGNPRNFSGLLLPAGNSDAARQVWDWILADPEAKAWLDGSPDEWGMVVNPVYATDAQANSSGAAFGVPLPESFPKGDPFCYMAPPRGSGSSIVPPALCGTDWQPYTRGFADSAVQARQAYDGARIVENPFALSSSDVWRRDVPQTIGRRSMLALTDTASAAQFGLQTASLSQSGDNDDDRRFLAPNSESLLSGVTAMAPQSDPNFLEPTVNAVEGGSAPPDAYPLTVLTYGAIKPLNLDPAGRADYANFVEFAATDGQAPGLEPGRLPRGYVPLPAALAAQSQTAAATIRSLELPATPQPIPPESSQPVVPNPAPVPASESPTTTVLSRPAAAPGTSPPANRPTSPSSPTSSTVPTEPAEDAPVTETTESVAEQEVPIAEDADEPAAASAATPPVDTGRVRYAVVGLGVFSLLSALGALEISKLPRRRTACDGELSAALGSEP